MYSCTLCILSEVHDGKGVLSYKPRMFALIKSENEAGMTEVLKKFKEVFPKFGVTECHLDGSAVGSAGSNAVNEVYPGATVYKDIEHVRRNIRKHSDKLVAKPKTSQAVEDDTIVSTYHDKEEDNLQKRRKKQVSEFIKFLNKTSYLQPAIFKEVQINKPTDLFLV